MTQHAEGRTVDPAEIARFSTLSETWWDPRGKMRPLHQLNPVRLAYIRDMACSHFSRDAAKMKPLAGLRLADIGCGAGLLCEPLSRMGAEVLGLDASATNIEVAKLHAEKSGATVDYRCTTAEDLAAAGETFDIVLAMEVVEHVTDVSLFMETCAGMVKPGGLLFAATLNRTLKSFALAIVGAEYVLRWLPKGTHQWDKFVTPDELEAALTLGGIDILDRAGVSYDVLGDRWKLTRDMDVNYMMVGSKG